jgi:hypothetical protein
MRTMMRVLPPAMLIVAAAFSLGCEDSPLSAGKDYTMTLIAQPQTVVINPATGIDSAQTSILATVLNKDSVPQQGVTVYFSNKGGTLNSGVSGVKTNASGIASDTLTVTTNDPAEIDVTATSAALTATVKITKSTVAVNRPPTAGIAAVPADEQATGQSVIFDGSASTDPDTGDSITMYKWVITSTNPDPDKTTNPIIAEGPGVSGVSFPSDAHTAFTNLQDLTVTLLITDDPNAPAVFAAHQPVAYRAQQTIPYRIVAVRCSDNTKPTAIISGAATQQIFGFPSQTTPVNFLVDGTLSTDPETAIETYTWNCGNGSIPLPQGNGSKAVCKYYVDQTPRTYTVTLVVTDRGTGSLVNGTYECATESTAASIQVIVSPLATP